jgi:pyridoxamine 5'-phosphate oxidase
MSASTDRDFGEERRDYNRDSLDDRHLPPDPMTLFMQWMDEAMSSGNPEPTAMTLSTVDDKGHPSSRIVLLKKVEAGRLLFFTNYLSRKAQAMAHHEHVALHFHWQELERQVKINGWARVIDPGDSEAYFRTRPPDSQLAAWASPQSKEIPDRAFLEKSLEKYRAKFAGGEVPRPPLWGGYAVTPSRMEFWQGRKMRLHDRIEYRLEEGSWVKVRLAP